MSVQIVIEGPDGASNIDISRQATNQSNLQDAIDIWRSIINLQDESHAHKHQKDVIKTIKSRLKKNAHYYGSQDFAAVKKMIGAYLDAHPWLQINFCKDSTRQGVDEIVQRRMLNHFVHSAEFMKAPSGVYVCDGKIWKKGELKRARNQSKLDIKDIDTMGWKGEKEIFIFQKYTKVAGGHQDNVYAESLHFIQEFNRYVDENEDLRLFIAQLDGEYIEGEIPRLRKEIRNRNRVFVGKSEQVIDWLNGI